MDKAASDEPSGPSAPARRQAALRFVLLIGVLSLFADFTYEGSRSIIGPFLGSLAATGLVVGVVTGFGEFLGYALRLVSGRLADATTRYWPITIFGYVVQMAAVPALALAHSWPVAALLIILERVGKAIRNPPRDTMLSHVAKDVGGLGWAFGINESLDQAGAVIGPLVVAAVLAHGGEYRLAFAILLIPAIVNVSLVLLARFLYPNPLPVLPAADDKRAGFPRTFWIYLAGAALVAAGFVDYPLVAFHFARAGTVPGNWIAAFYAVAMAVGGVGSLVLGRLFDRFGFVVLIVLTAISAAFAPLVFYGGFWAALIGAALWGLGMGVHESMIPAAVAPMVPVQRRASAFGLFTAGYGIFWFIGSSIIGLLYDFSLAAVVAFCIATQLIAIPVFIWVGRRTKTETPARP